MPQQPTLPLDRLGPIGDEPLNADALATYVDEHERLNLPRYALLWRYYRNPMELGGPALSSSTQGRRYRLAQEQGLPPRITGATRNSAVDDRAAARREVVIENDIAWRVQAMVDYLFSRPVRLVSTAADPSLRARIERALDACWERSGGSGLLQDAALLGHVYGHADLLVRADADLAAERPAQDDAELVDAARRVRIELVAPPRGIPIQNPADYRELDGYIIRSQRSVIDPGASSRRRTVTFTEVFSASTRQLYRDRADGHGPQLIDEASNNVSPGRLPIAHIQNVSQPLAYSGLSEVEPLIPLQDELNTRLSDRASRVTMQSFKMYLAKGIEGFDKTPIGPGQMWSTDNTEASITAFGGDADSPSEEAHIDEIREALDKASSLPPLATGVVRAKIGNLTSENALRLTLGGVLTRTNRKRLSYGRGITLACRFVLDALHHAGILITTPDQRGVTVEWPDPLPQSPADALEVAKRQADLGVNQDRVLAGLGVGRADQGVA